MNFSQLNPLLSETVTLLKIEFADSTGLNYPKTIHGTGFWIRNSENALTLVTNRHNLDPSLKDMRMKDYRIGKIEILAREYIDGLYKLLNRGIFPWICRRKKPGKVAEKVEAVLKRMRWKVERAISWLQRKFRRLAVRWERKTRYWKGFLTFSLIIFWVDRLVR